MIETSNGKKFYTEFEQGYQQGRLNVLDEFTEYFLSTDCLNTDCPYVGENLDRCTPCLINKFKEQNNERRMG